MSNSHSVKLPKSDLERAFEQWWSFVREDLKEFLEARGAACREDIPDSPGSAWTTVALHFNKGTGLGGYCALTVTGNRLYLYLTLEQRFRQSLGREGYRGLLKLIKREYNFLQELYGWGSGGQPCNSGFESDYAFKWDVYP